MERGAGGRRLCSQRERRVSVTKGLHCSGDSDGVLRPTLQTKKLQTRWFVLKNSRLHCFKSPKDTKPYQTALAMDSAVIKTKAESGSLDEQYAALPVQHLCPASDTSSVAAFRTSWTSTSTTVTPFT
jgi:hypothetical protein